MIWTENQDFTGIVSGMVAEDMVFGLNVILTTFNPLILLLFYILVNVDTI